jgi:DNA polymerase-3 subunit delta
MLIKHQNLDSYLANKTLPAIYILTGQEYFLLSESANQIKLKWQKENNDSEEVILHVSNPSDWALVNEKARSYNLFAPSSLLDVRYEKPSLDPEGRHFLSSYANQSNPSCLVLIRAPALSIKQLSSLTSLENIHVIQLFPLDELAVQNWIKNRLQKNGIKFESSVPMLVYQYTKGNMLACAQALEKIQLITDETILTAELAKTQLIDQCEYQLFELSDACLLQQPDRVIQQLRHANHSGAEPTLILWLLAQEIRNLIQLIELTQQSIAFTTACTKLKIWSNRVKFYQMALKHLRKEHLLSLLQFCKTIDDRIKSNQGSLVWQGLEKIALSLCLGKEVGALA